MDKVTASLRAAVGRFVEKYFPERQFFLRSRGRVRFVEFSPKQQIAGTSIAALCLAWAAFTTASMMAKDSVIETKNQRLAQMENAYRVANDDRSRMEHHFLAATRAIEAKHLHLANMIDRKLAIENRLAQVSNRLDGKAIRVEKSYGGVPVPVARETVTAVLPASARAILAKTAALPNLTGVDGRLGAVRDSQRDLIIHLQENTESNVNELESMIQVTGLDVDRLLSEKEISAQAAGGPFILPGELDLSEAPADAFEGRLVKLAGHLTRLAGLEAALQSLPLIPPTRHYYVSSKYGMRRDPVTRQWSMHAGIDLAGVKRSPIMASAPGIITYAARKGPYGKMVEIDHGQGIKTRYGHLHKMMVKRGDHVAFRQEIGQMGTTGRTTGPHVHYEIWFDGRPRDPANFLKAGRYVFRN